MAETAPDVARWSESQASAAEAATRAERPPTDTVARALAVFVRSTSPRVILGLIGLTLAIRVALGAPLQWVEFAMPVVTAVWWPIQEWAAHRWILHIKPRRVLGVWFDPYFARRHRRHHANPSLFADVFLPARVVLGAWVTFGGLFVLCGMPPNIAATLLLSISSAALLYEWVHFYAHTDHRPATPYFARLVTNHRLHHYRNEQHWFAFTVPQLDEWFGTGGAPRAVEVSATARTLGVPPEPLQRP